MNIIPAKYVQMDTPFQSELVLANRIIQQQAEINAALKAENGRLQMELDKYKKAEAEGRLELLNDLAARLAREETIISGEVGKDYAHLDFKDGRSHTLMRVKAWTGLNQKRIAAEASEPTT